MRKILYSFVVSLPFFFLFSSNIYASVLFEDDFNSYQDGSFPSKWETYNSTCSADWYVDSGILKITIAQHPCSENIIPNPQNWHELDEYIIEFDIIFKSGVDRHFHYRINPSLGYRSDLHFTSNGFLIFKGLSAEGFYRGYVTGVKYHYKIIVTTNDVKVYESSVLNPNLSLININSNLDLPLEPGFIGLGSAPGSGIPTETWFDNIRVTTLDHDDNQQELNVPLLKQTNPLWAGVLYDSADAWAPPEPVDISRWGCAITSAAMIFQYHGITKMPDGTALNPKAINDWLKEQPDGYQNGGNVYFYALSRLSKLANPQNPNFAFDSLEYTRFMGPNKNQLTTDLQNNIPDILEVPGHFIVAKGIDGETFSINDPFYNYTDLTSYANTFKSLRQFTPSNSDLSYIVISTDENINVAMQDGLGNFVGEEFIQDPIEAAGDPGDFNTDPVRMFHHQKPASGNYTFKLSSPIAQNYDLDILLYDIEGEVNVVKLEGFLGSNQTQEYTIIFDKEDSSNSNSHKVVTYESLRQSIVNGYSQHKLEFGTYVALLALLNNAEKANKPEISVKMLDQMILLISKDKKIAFDFAQELTSDINTLKESF